jgi:CD109 antigen
MVGGMTGKVPLTAYVAIALMQSSEKEASGKAIAYLEEQLDGIDDAYTMALTAYALELGGSEETEAAYQKLMDMAQEDENGLYWGDVGIGIPEGASFRAEEPQIMPQENRTAVIETTAYATLALTRHGDNINAGRAAQWLVSQRNAYGGYGSTQDTVVALEALTRFSTGAGADTNLTVTVKAGDETIKQLRITSENYDVLQVVELPTNREINITVKGEGEAIGQIVRRYNLPEAEPAADILQIAVDYDATSVEVNDIVTVSVELAFNPPTQMQAGMTVLDISVPTGFSPVTESIEKAVAKDPNIKRYDVAGRKVIFYIEDMFPGDRVTFSFQVQALYPVKAKGVTSQAYSYYQPEISTKVLGLDMTIY